MKDNLRQKLKIKDILGHLRPSNFEQRDFAYKANSFPYAEDLSLKVVCFTILWLLIPP